MIAMLELHGVSQSWIPYVPDKLQNIYKILLTKEAGSMFVRKRWWKVWKVSLAYCQGNILREKNTNGEMKFFWVDSGVWKINTREPLMVEDPSTVPSIFAEIDLL